MRFRTALLSLMTMGWLSACGKGLQGAKAQQGDFVPYVDAFERSATDNGKELHGASYLVPIRFGTTEQSMAFAECRWNVVEGSAIVVDQKRWDDLDESTRKALMFHELGHCVLGRGHRDDKFTLQSEKAEHIPTSVMNTILISGKLFEQYRALYEEELFQNQVNF